MEQVQPRTGIVGETQAIMEKYGLAQAITITDPATKLEVPAVIEHGKIRIIAQSEFDGVRTAPIRRKGVARLTALDSLIDHVQRFKSAESALFAVDDAKKPAIVAVLNYHKQGSDGAPDFGDHRAVYDYPVSEEWKAWTAANLNKMTQAEFALFLEDHINDVIPLIVGEDQIGEELERYINTCGGGEPASPQRLVDLSRRLDVYENSTIKSATKLQSGEGEISFASEHVDSDGKPVKVPGLFMIAIPVFRNGPMYRIAVRLRYRVSGGLSFFFEMWRADKAFDVAFHEGCQRVAIETELPLFFGEPE